MKQPRFKKYMGPLLDALRSLGGSGTPNEVIDQIARDLSLPEETLNEVRKSGGLKFPSQVKNFAIIYLKREGLVASYEYGVWSLTDKGRKTHLSMADAEKITSHWDKIFATERKNRK